CFKNQPFTYLVEGRIITLVPIAGLKPAVNKVRPMLDAEPPFVDVRGRIVNDNGEPLEGITVSVKGTKIVALTNSNGEFEIKNLPEDAVLVFTGTLIETFETKTEG